MSRSARIRLRPRVVAMSGSDATGSEVITEGDGAPDQLFVIDIRAAG